MAKNKIGIEVQVEFPTIAELQRQLQEKWAKIQNKFELNVSFGVDESALKALRTEVESYFKRNPVDVKLDFDIKDALKNIETINKKITNLDKRMKRAREIKVNVNVEQFDKLDKALGGIINKAKQTGSAFKSQEDDVDGVNNKLKIQASLAEKIVNTHRKLKDGTISSTVKSTYKNDSGDKLVVTETDNDIKVLQFTKDRKKELQEIHDLMKKVNALKIKEMDAEGEHKQILKKELRIEEEQLANLKEMYKAKHGISSMESASSKELKRLNDMNIELKEQSLQMKRIKSEQDEISSALSRYAQIEKNIISLKRSAVDASEQEKQAIGGQVQYLQRIQSELNEKYNLLNRISDEQRRELQNIQDIAKLQEMQVRAKKESVEAQRKEQSVAKEMLDSLQKIHKLEVEIAQLKANSNKSGNERLRLSILEDESKELKEQHSIAMRVYQQEGLVTNELKQQLGLQEQVNKKELDRATNIARQYDNQSRSNALLKEYVNTTKQIAQLQRDLIFSGLQEQQVIESQISKLEAKRHAIKENLTSQNQMTEAVEREVRAIEEAQREQMELNRLRQVARERDQYHNYNAGVVDPYSYYSDVNQMARGVLEPVARLDEALVSVTRVAEGTEEQFKEFADGSYHIASQLGVTADQYAIAVSKWVTAGKNFTESQELAQKSVIGSSVGNINVDDMVKYMSVPLVAYEKAGLKADDIINTMNETANTNAIEMDELGKAYMRSATTVKDLGTSYGELTGMITAAQEATRKGGERIGTGLKSIAMNMTNINAQMTAGEEKKYNFLTSKGVAFRDANGEMLSMTQILDNLVGVWDDLSTAEKGTAKYYLAGKEHAETLGAIIDQWETVNEVSELTEGQLGLGTDGSAYIEHAKQADTVKRKLVELKNTWDELMYAVGGGQHGVAKVLGVITEGLEELIKVANNEELMRSLKFILMGVGLHAGTNAIIRLIQMINGGLANMQRNARNVATLFGQLKKNNPTGGGTTGGGTVIATRGGSTRGSVSGTGRQRSTNTQTNSSNRTTSSTANTAKQATGALTTIATFGKLAGNLLKFVPFLGNAIMLLELAGVPVFSKIGEVLNDMVTTTQELRTELDTSAKKFEATNGIVNGKIKEMNEGLNGKENKDGELKGGLRQRYEELKGDKGKLTADEFKTFKAEFNKWAEDAGLDVRLTVNGGLSIEEAFKQAEKNIDTIEVSNIKDYDKGVTKQRDTGNKAKAEKEKQEKLLKELEQRRSNIEKAAEEARKKVKKGTATDLDYSAIENEKQNLANIDAEIAKVQQKIDGFDGVMKEANKNIKKYTDGLANYIAEGGDISGMSQDQALRALTPMITQYEKVAEQLRNVQGATDALNSSNEVSAEQWDKLTDVYPELKDFDLELINTKDELGEAEREAAQAALESGEKKKNEYLETTEVAMNELAKQAGFQDGLSASIGSGVNMQKELKDEIAKTSEEIEKVPKEKTFTMYFKKIGSSILEGAKKLFSSGNDSVTIEEGKTSGSVSVSNKGITSASVSSDGNASSIIGQPTQISSFATSTDSANSDAKVSEDVWRYWGKELYDIGRVESALNNLTSAMTKAGDNQVEMIKLYKQQQSLLKEQMSHNQSLLGAKDSEMKHVLSQLTKYGFKVNTSTGKIDNLSHAKSLNGDKASEAETLLNTWKSLYSELDSIKQNIQSMSDEILSIDKSIKEANIALEFNNFEKNLKKIDALLTSVGNDNTISSLRLGLVGEKNSELSLFETESAMNLAKKNMSTLISEFNKLSTTTVNYEENATELKASLDGLGASILGQADAIMQYQQQMNDLEISRLTKDMEQFNASMDKNVSKLNNNIQNLKDGLLSGTSLSDLQSSMTSSLDLNRKNAFEKQATERINLEKQVQDALAGFAKKNVDREVGVANETLKIKSNMYNEMLRMQSDYTSGSKASYSEISSAFGALSSIGKIDDDYKFITQLDKSFKNLKDKQDRLSKQFEKDMSKAVTQDDQDSITNKYIVDNLKLQEDYLNASIGNYKGAIKELQGQLADSTVNDTQRDAIMLQIESYEEAITNAQNSIKDSIRERFEFENSLMNEVIDKYDKYISEIDYAMSLIDSIGGNNYESKNVIYSEMYSVEKSRNKELSKTLENLESQLKLYKEGSFEWGIINSQVDEFNTRLKDSNVELLSINKNLLSNSFDKTMNALEKKVFNGKTLDEFSAYQELWMSGIEREIALEEAYQRMADLGNSTYQQKMALLEKQEKLSKYEMDYLNKQLDIIELEQKLSNLNKEKTVQTLRQGANGTWDYVYEADAEQVRQAQKDLQQSRLELEQLQQDGMKDYIEKLEGILANVEEGLYESESEFVEAVGDLGEAFKAIVDDVPEISSKYLEELFASYKQYLAKEGDVLSSAIKPVSNELYTGFSDDMIQVFDNVGKSMAETFVDTLISKVPHFNENAIVSKSSSGDMTINIDNIDFPNIKDASGIKEAIFDLPRLALQASKSK